MSVSKMVALNPGVTMNVVLDGAARNLQQQGYDVTPTMMGPTSGMLTVQKDRDGIKNFLGMGLECRATLTVNGNCINLNIEHEWTNKIIALAVGWILCWVPFITGIIGAVNQNGLPEKISAAVMAASAGGGMPGYGMPQNGYAQPQNGYAQPQMGYDQPQAGYDQSQGGYIPPQQ